MFESNPVKNKHFTKLLISITSGMCEIGSGKNKICLLHGDHCERHFYLFPLSAQGHCFHDDSLMASFASLFLIFFFFTPLPSYLQYLCLKTPHDRRGPTSPFTTHCPLLFIPDSPFLKPWCLKDKMKKIRV